ncbi:hypothetical protein [Rhodoblastus sp.]|uniref:hypothetical protein n=1 Tax=Rhodoblastus sp. TaxID=1962975 RepID=UPI0035B34CC7
MGDDRNISQLHGSLAVKSLRAKGESKGWISQQAPAPRIFGIDACFAYGSGKSSKVHLSQFHAELPSDDAALILNHVSENELALALPENVPIENPTRVRARREKPRRQRIE